MIRTRKHFIVLLMFLMGLAMNACDFSGNNPTTTDKLSTATSETMTFGETYSVTFESMGGSIVESISYIAGSQMDLPTPVLPGYIFMGWYLTESYNGDAIFSINSTMSGDITFYAKWTFDISSLIYYKYAESFVFPDHCIDISGESPTIIQEHLDELLIALSIMGISESYLIDNQEYQQEFSMFDFSSVNLEVVLESDIMHATISNIFWESYEDSYVPKYSIDGEVVKYIDQTDMTAYISKAEICTFFSVVGNYDDLDISAFANQGFELVLQSSIIHAILSYALFYFESIDAITIPYYDIDSNPVFVTVGENENETKYILEPEIVAIFNSFEHLGFFNLSSIDLYTIINELTQEDVSVLLDSAILYATISEHLLGNARDAEIRIPFYDQDSIPLIIEISSGESRVEYIAESELEDLFDTFIVWGIYDFQSIECISLNSLADSIYMEILLRSNTLHLYFSDYIISLLSDASQIPASAYISFADSSGDIDVLTYEEIKDFLSACIAMQINDIYDVNIGLDKLLTYFEDEDGIVLDSMIIRLYMTEELENLAESLNIILTAEDYDFQVVGGSLTKTTVISILTAYQDSLTS